MDYLDMSKTSLTVALLAIAFNPTAWNIVARNGKYARADRHWAGLLTKRDGRVQEQDHHAYLRGEPALGLLFPGRNDFLLWNHSGFTVSRPTGPPSVCCSAFERRYHRALADQPTKAILPEPLATVVPVILFLVGQTFVVTSTWALGITGTFLGDYFGILMDHRVEGFPFNVLRDPMYVGSTMCFAAGALW